MKRWLNLYDNKFKRFDVKRCLAEANLVRGDLLEIFAQWNEEDVGNVLRWKTALASLELLTDLTWPLERDNESTTVNHHRHLPYLSLSQVEYKRAILQHDSGAILRKVIALAIPAMMMPRKDRMPRDEGTIKIMLYLFRNLVTIAQPRDMPSQGDENELTRSAVIDAFHQQDVLQLLLTLSSGMGEDFIEQDVLVLEVLFHLLKGIDPKKIFREDKQVTDDNTKQFRDLLLKEKAMFAGNAKNAPTRHNRFGTMIWVKRADDKVSTLTGQDVITSDQRTLQKMDKTKIWNKPRYNAKRNQQTGEHVDLLPIPIDAKARAQLRGFVCGFLDSSFNPLFTTLRRAIERENERVKEDHARQYFYLTSWFLRAEEARRAADRSCPTKTATQAGNQVGDTPFAYVAGVLNQENFVLLNRTMQQNMDDKQWHDVHMCILAFTQILLTVSAMAESPSEDDQEIAENIQNRIFYEETTHDRVVQILKGYKEGLQGFWYLDACTDMAHVFLRLLERYSKTNADMQIRSKRRARNKAKAEKADRTANVQIEGLEETDPVAEPEDDAEDERQEQIQAHREVQERKFDFSRFAARFVNETCIDTFMHLANYYLELNIDQLKRCHRFFYRVAFKMDKAILLFRVDHLSLFSRMIGGPSGLETSLERKSEHFKEWEELVKQIFRRCIKKLEERPEMMIEMLFTKLPNTLFYLENGYDKQIVKSAPRPPAELEIKPGMELVDQIGVAVGALLNQGKLDALTWVKSVLESGAQERRSWEDQNAALTSLATTEQQAPASETEARETPEAPPIVVSPDNEERRVATFKDKHLRLLLKTLSFQRLGAPSEPQANWTIPPTLTADQLSESLEAIKKFEFDPPSYEDGKSAENFIRNVLAARSNAYEKEASDEEDGDSDIDEALYAPGGPNIHQADGEAATSKPKKRRLKRPGEGISEAEALRRLEQRRRKDREKDVKIKSTLFVTESDDEEDDDRDREFFQLEAQRRGKMKGAIDDMLMKEALDADTEHELAQDGTSKKRRRKGDNVLESRRGKKVRSRHEQASDGSEQHSSSDSEAMDLGQALASSRASSRAPEVRMDISSDEEDDDMDTDAAAEGETPPSSQMQAALEAKAVDGKVLAEISGNGGARTVDSEDEDNGPIAKAPRRMARASVFFESDSE